MTSPSPPPHTSLSQFVLRTPSLPIDVLARWGAMSGIGERRALLRQLVADPIVREALFVASPELDAQIASWQQEPDTAANAGVERALVRYVSRMASRSTPFGLFASVAIGNLGERTRLTIPPRDQAWRHTRLDNDVLFALTSELARDAAAKQKLRYRPNTSLYSAAARLRYAEARLAGASRSYHLVAVSPSDYLQALLAKAQPGATRTELISVLTADPEISEEDASGFLDEVIDTQILVPLIGPHVTGPEPTEGLIELLRGYGLDEHAATLQRTRDAITAIDAARPGVSSDQYRAIEADLAAHVPIKIEANRLFQVDLFKPAADTTISTQLAAELVRVAQILHTLAPAPSGGEWGRFRERFSARYETREVPLLEALDDENGIGFGGGEGRAAPLLAGIPMGGRGGPRTTSADAGDFYKLQLVVKAIREGATEIVLTDADLEKLAERAPTPLPDTIGISAVLCAPSPEAVDAGDYTIRVIGVGSSAQLLGRFAHGSADALRLAEACLRAEEAHHPDAVFAEIVHLPEGRLGNILLRPVLREYEIPYLGTSGAPADKQITLDDLLVSVAGDRVVLRSKRLNQEVIPRLTTAHNYQHGALPPYKFLCMHAEQGRGYAYWPWGIADSMPFLPRVTYGKYVIARARWTVGATDLGPLEKAFAGLATAKTPEHVTGVRAKVAAAVAALRTRLSLPRWVVIADSDNELPVDLDNELMVDSAAHMLKGRPSATLYELYPLPENFPSHGSEGTFAHEIVLMAARPPAPRPSRMKAAPTASAAVRRFLPGSEWLYLKIYSGTSSADQLLRDHLAPIIRGALAEGIASDWFFIRYGDPDLHLRVRFTGDPARLTGQLLPALHKALQPAVDAGLAYRITLDTYEREVERYGGPHAIRICESIFRADSDLVLGLVQHLAGDAGADAAWRICLRSVDRLLDDLGFSLPAKLGLATHAREAFGREMGASTATQKALGDKYRRYSKELIGFLALPDASPEHAFAPALALIAARSAALRPLVAQLDVLAAAGTLTSTREELADSLVHMHVNRMMRSHQRQHELVIYDLLKRHYEGLIARSKSK